MEIIRPGRPSLDEAELLRRKVWYFYVISKTEMTHYEMDIKFDLEWDKKGPSEGLSKRRRKIMEELRDRNIMPFKRELQKFLALVESRVKDTAEIYNSFVWAFLDKKPLSANDLRDMIVNILRKYGAFHRKSYQELNRSPEITKLFTSKYQDFSNLRDYIQNLQNVTNLITNYFDKLAFLGALFREAYYSMDLEVAYYLNHVYMNHVYEIEDSEILPDSEKRLFIKVCQRRLYIHKNAVNKKYVHILKRDAKSTPAYNLLVDEQEGIYV
jgi:hypothetical protein